MPEERRQRLNERRVFAQKAVATVHQSGDTRMFAADRTVHPRGKAFEIVPVDFRYIEQGVNGSLLVRQGGAGERPAMG